MKKEIYFLLLGIFLVVLCFVFFILALMYGGWIFIFAFISFIAAVFSFGHSGDLSNVRIQKKNLKKEGWDVDHPSPYLYEDPKSEKRTMYLCLDFIGDNRPICYNGVKTGLKIELIVDQDYNPVTLLSLG